MENDSRFIEQAEYIPTSDFIEWSSEHPNEDFILKKLTQAGAKLLTGPRGCGKTTLILKAYNKLCQKNSKGAFPVYVNFKASLKLEPAYRSKANGGFWFSQWMYLKIYEGIYRSLDDLEKKISDINLTFPKKKVEKLISLLELGEIDRVKDQSLELTVYELEDDIDKVMESVKKSRCVLLLDDAAHAFSPEQQHDFFEFFRKIKSRSISPKAAIYPGVTNFSPTFNIGHDAEEIDAWVNPEEDDYFWFMQTMLARRLPTEVYEKLSKDSSLLKSMCFASFGIPRILLNMARNFYIETENDGVINYEIKFTRRNLLKQIKVSYDSALAIYSSLSQKLPTYKNYIDEGLSVYNRAIDLVKVYNRDKDIHRKSITLAIKKDISSDLRKILGFFQYAGMASHKGQVSRGVKGVFELYILNLSALIDNNAILAAKAFKTDDLATALANRNAHEFTRTQSISLLPISEGPIRLSMPPCQACGAERSHEEARFCHNCGAPLKAASIYENLVGKDIEVLTLTSKRINAIKDHSSIRTVKDILYDIDHKELRSVPQIGEHWASKIYYLAEEYIS